MNFFIYMIYIMIFAGWIIISYFKAKKWKDRKERCTLKIYAQVVDVFTIKPRRGTVLLHKPILKVSLAGSDHIIKTALFTHLIKFDTGEEILIYVNPNNPQDFIYGSPYNERLMYLDLAGCLLPLPMIIMMTCWLFF